MTRPRHAYLLASTALVLILAAGAFAQQVGAVKTDRVALLFAERFPVEMTSPALPLANPPVTPLPEESRPAVDDASPIVLAEQPPDCLLVAQADVRDPEQLTAVQAALVPPGADTLILSPFTQEECVQAAFGDLGNN